MKKIYIIALMILIITLVACGNTSTSITTENPTTSGEVTTSDTVNNQTTTNLTTNAQTTQTTETYDPRGLVPEDLEYLDNIDDWQPVFADEFNYEGVPDSSKWLYDVGGNGWGNNEEQYYTSADPDNAYAEDGTLKITAIKENFMGSEYTSARIVSKYRGDFRYGRIQVRAKLPSGTGTWPAIWMLPTQNEYGGWPYSGEIDIMEHVGYDSDTVFGTVHTGARNGSLGNQIGFPKTLPTAETAFHVYELIWEPGFMQVLIDGEVYGYFGYNPLVNIDISNSDAWPFDQEFHIIMNLAIGGNWGGIYGVDDSIFPQSLEVDYVRVYQKDYAGLDNEKPSQVTGITTLTSDYNSIKISWDKAEDDVAIDYYDIFVNDVLVGEATVNAFLIEDLDPNTNYTITVIANDFAGNRSDSNSLTLSTKSLKTVEEGVIEAENYNNQSGVFRENDASATNGQYVGYIDNDDYMEYILYVPETASFKINFRVASTKAGQIKIYGKALYPFTTLDFSATGGDLVWGNVSTDTFTLYQGSYTFKVKASIGGFNLDNFEFEKVE